MRSFNQRASLLYCCAFAFLLDAGPVQTVTAEEADSGDRGIEEIIVYSRYREEAAQDTPTALTAFNSSVLERITAQDLRDVGPLTPNVRIQPVVTFPNSAAIHIRGMGQQNIESTNEMRNGVSINGVFISRPIATLIDFFDVDTLEVLRGPQGTTFGKNSLSGGLSINTIRPDGTLDYKTEVTAGNYGRLDFRGAVQFPIIEDKLSARISVLLQNYDGHYKNRVNGKDLNGEDIDSIRATLVWTPTENFEATLIASWLKERSDAPGGDDASDPNQLLPIIFGFTEPDDGPFTVGRDALDFHNTDQNGLTTIVNWDVGDYTLTSVTGYVETDDFIASDFDQTEIPFFPTFRDQVHDQLSQEIRVHSNFEDRDDILGNVEFVIGLFYFTQEHELVQSFPTLGPSADYANQDGDSRAIFGQLIYSLTEDLNFTFGVRNTRETKRFRRNPGAFQPQIRADDASTRPSIGEMSRTTMTVFGDLDSSNTTFKVGLDYSFNDNVMGFFNFAQGFKAGEFGARAASFFTVGPTDDEESDSYELGIKSDLMDGLLRVNATVFNTNFENLQFGVFIPNPNNPTGQETANQNIGESTHRGLELEVVAMPMEGLTVTGSLGLLDAQYDKFCADLDGPSAETNPVSNCGGKVVALPDGTFLVDRDETSRELSRAPQRQIYIEVEYEWPTSIGRFSIRGAGNYESEYFSDGVLNHPKAKTGDFWLWDASARWTSPNDQWRVQAWCKNCSDKVYTSGLTPTAQFFNQHFYGLPQTYGLTLSYRK
jgi:iron complex outermembrane recepter protein